MTLQGAHDRDEAGFTLVELLVVIIVIGILAAVAVPVFLAQRQKAYDGAARYDLKNMATAQETHLAENGGFTADVDQLTSHGFRPSTGVTGAIAVTLGTSQYCLQVTSRSGEEWTYSSGAPVSVKGSC